VSSSERVDLDVVAALARERERTRALREVGLLIDSSLPPDELLERILAAAARVAEAERATLYLVGEDGRTLRSHATEGSPLAAAIVLPIDKGIAGACALSGMSIRVSDAYEDPRFDRAWDLRSGFRTRAVLAVPMRAPDRRLLGVIQVLNRRDRGVFDDDDVATLEALAAQAAVALEAARTMTALLERNRALSELRARLERSLRERELLLGLEQLLSREESADAFLDGALEALLRACGAGSGVIALTDSMTGVTSLRAVRGIPDAAAHVGRAVSPTCAVARACSEGDALGASPGSPALESALPGPATAILVAPLGGEADGPRGAIELRDPAERGFGEDDRALLTLVAATAATAIELLEGRTARERTSRLETVGRTLGNVLHDIRTPMTVISGYAQLMPEVDSREERAKYAQAIVRQFALVQAMIAELLAFVRGDSQVLLQRTPLEPFFTDLVDVLRRYLAGRNVRVTLDLRERGAARLDPTKITRLVHNLARNAADALASRAGGGTFSITVWRDGEQLVIELADDGPGIPDEVRAKLFQSFVTRGKPNGTGLGLAIAKKVVDDHRGTIDVHTSPEGTRFIVRLPQQVTRTMPAIAAS
jgi:signal transduction histidine kinase